MKVSKKQLQQIIREEQQRLALRRNRQDFGSNAARQEMLQEQGPSGIEMGQTSHQFEDAIYAELGAMLDKGMDEDMAAQVILDNVKIILGF